MAMARLVEPGEAVSHRSNNFDFIRLAMALAVIWSHGFALYYGNEDREWVSLLLGEYQNAGNLAVMVFFMISGFLITQSWMRSRSLASYIEKRVRRIYPGYLVATLVCAFVVVPVFSTIMKLDVEEILRTIGFNLLFRNYFPPSNAFTANPVPNAVNGSLWSIPFEMWCYVGVAALGLMSLLRRRWLLVALLVAVLVLRVVLDLQGRKPGLGLIGVVFGWPYMWVQILPSFLLGMIAWSFRESLPRHPAILVGLAVAAIGACHLEQNIAKLLVAPALAYAVFYLGFSRRISLPDAARHGDFSYGTYLYAYPIQQMIWALWGHRIGFPSYLVLSFALSLPAGIASWFLVERWFLPRRR